MTGEITERLRECAEMAGSGDELARLSAIPRRTLESYLTGESELKVSRALAVSDAVGVRLDWLIAGRGPKLISQASLQLEGMPEDFDDRFALIPLYDARISSGHGAWNEGAKVLTKLAFTRYSLKKKGLDPDFLAAVRNDGDSNEPMLADGDTVMVDLRVTRVDVDAFYVVRLEERLYAKRLQVSFDGSLNIISENKAYKDILVPKDRVGEVEIVGRACWAGRWLS